MDHPPLELSPGDFLPRDGFAGALAARAWLPGPVPGPAVVAIREEGVFDISAEASTMASLLERADAAQVVRTCAGVRLGGLDELLVATAKGGPKDRLHFLAPCDLQVVKAAGVTFAASLLERVIEERAGGDPGKAESIRAQVRQALGADLRTLRPGSPQAQQLKSLLVEQGMWSQYLEVGIGPDAEVFTKAPVLAAVGTGMEVGVHPASSWNNPEPEVVLAVDSAGTIKGAALGNDVNLRDIEGRSALLLGKAKDNNASCAIGPFIRLFDETFSLDDLRQEDLELTVVGADGFTLRGASTLREISRDPLDLVAQAFGAHHQYPDGFMLFLGTLFAPVQDRDAPGRGFTHHVGDVVTIRSPRLGTLRNRVNTSDRIAPWSFGIRALMASLAARGLVGPGRS